MLCAERHGGGWGCGYSKGVGDERVGGVGIGHMQHPSAYVFPPTPFPSTPFPTNTIPHQHHPPPTHVHTQEARAQAAKAGQLKTQLDTLQLQLVAATVTNDQQQEMIATLEGQLQAATDAEQVWGWFCWCCESVYCVGGGEGGGGGNRLGD